MADWQAIRELARSGRSEVAGSAASLITAEDLIRLALDREGLWSQPVDPDDPALAGADALLLRDARGILYNADFAPERTRFNIAHELAHWWLHDESSACHAEDILPDPVTDPLPYGEDAVRGYSPAQRREVEANVFAAEFLLPISLVREQFLAGLTPADLAATFGIPESTVHSQMAEALLTNDERRSTNDERRLASDPTTQRPNDPTTVDADVESVVRPPSSVIRPPSSVLRPPSSVTVSSLDPSQRAAAETQTGPTLVVAGPGTGKTRTLIARIQVLLDRAVSPERILALTFSNRAADEMRERLAATAPEAARRVWIGTFHAFGLELLRRFGTHLGLPPAPALIDPLDSIGLLESRLSELNLIEYEYLHNPIFPFRDILSAISRAKDELVSPERYAELANAMASEAADDKQRIEAARAQEVARVYDVWQRTLQEQGRLDFGDLLMRAVELLRNHADVLDHVRSEYQEILVDEYQDINRASAILVRLVAGNGRGLWAVGDLRQAIYGFRGAAPANFLRFEEDFPGGKRITLDVNYRSRPPIVQLFAAAADRPGAATPAWKAQRDTDLDSIVYAEADDEEAQSDGIAVAIRTFEERGIPLRDQAVLLRTNAQSEAMAGLLEKRGIPVVYLGDLLARPEVRDMLALLSLACEGNGSSLWRIARIPEYATSPDEILALLDRARAENMRFPDALNGCGLPGLERLFDHIAPLLYRGDAYYFLAKFLFGPASYLRDLVRCEDNASRQSRLALYQLLQLALSHARRALIPVPYPALSEAGAAAAQRPNKPTTHPHRAFLDHVRRLLVTREDTRARLPAGANAIPGVRLMTVHGSKGLEFPVVLLPNLAKDLFPSRARGSMVKTPHGLAPAEEASAEEDSRLFFVALSRARDHLVLSRPLTVNGKPRDASPLLNVLDSALSRVEAQRVHWSRTAPDRPSPVIRHPSSDSDEPLDLAVGEVEQYMRCPRQFYYQRVLKLPFPDQTSAYGGFQRSVWEVVRWAREERAGGGAPSVQDLEARLEATWNDRVPAGHPHAEILRWRASEILRSIADGESDPGPASVTELVAELPSGQIRVPIDHARETAEGGLVIERFISRRPGDDDHTRPRLALTRHAARQRNPAGSPEVYLRYLGSGETRAVPAQPRWEPARVEKYEAALRRIRSGEYDAQPSDDSCPFCPFFFVCPK